uniref:Uncharacterized protein n=1 Tax=Anguilla anguilla TaxID=7936 RepID=A0A0E9RAW9_ANGAN
MFSFLDMKVVMHHIAKITDLPLTLC